MAGLVRGILYSSWLGFSSSSSRYLTSVCLCSTSQKSGKQLDLLYPFMILLSNFRSVFATAISQQCAHFITRVISMWYAYLYP